MKRIAYFFFLMVPVVMISCQKELSMETGRLPGDSTIVTPGGNTCDLAQIIPSDSASGIGLYGYVSSFNTEHKVVNFDLIDSIRGSIDASFAITYPAGRIQIDAQQYFTVGTDGRVTEFHGYDEPDTKQGDKIIAKYTYNSAGQLTQRTYTYDSLPNIVFLRLRLTYSGNNLTNAVLEGNTGLTFIKICNVDYSYDATKTVKSNLYLYPASPELLLFQSMVNAGTKSVNPVSRAVSTIEAGFGLPAGTTTSNFINYVVDSKGYIQSFNTTGDSFVLANIVSHLRYKFRYNCY